MSEPAVRDAFAQQAAICARAGAPFTGRLCSLIGKRLTADSEIGKRVLNWPGVSSHEGDAVPLRLAGALHALARSGRSPTLQALYPPYDPSSDEALWNAVAVALSADHDFLNPWLDGPPQTNEVGRSAALMAGLLVLANRFGLPFSLFELGASAGLNSLLDRYGFQLGQTRAGDPRSLVQITPDWTGSAPPEAKVHIAKRTAVDRQPLDPADPLARERLSAFVWADQRDRLARLHAALDLAAADPMPVEMGDAADWLERVFDIEPEAGICRVVMHTIAFQYFSPDTKARVARRLADAGQMATPDSPVAWLTFEAAASGFERRPELTLTTWPGGVVLQLATAQPHGSQMTWLV